MLYNKGHPRILLFVVFICDPLPAEFSMDWHTVDAGGGSSSGGGYTMSGTIGQADSSGPIEADPFVLTGGFWGGFGGGLEGYAAWAAATIAEGQDASFEGDANHDGFANGLAYTFGADGLSLLLGGGVRAPPEAVPGDVILILQVSSDLENWERVLEYADGARTFVVPEVVIDQGVVVYSDAGTRIFYRYVAQLVP